MTLEPRYVADVLMGLFALIAVWDLMRLRIPNALPVAIVLLFPLWLMACHSTVGLTQNLGLFAGTLVGCTLLFSAGWIGGGDAKAMAAAALWFDVSGWSFFLAAVVIGGAVLAIALIVVRRLIPAPLAHRLALPALRRKGPIPYGIAIAFGGWFAIAQGHANPEPYGAGASIGMMLHPILAF